MAPQDWIQILSVATNISLLVVGVKLVRYISRMELKVDTMWVDFIHRHKVNE